MKERVKLKRGLSDISPLFAKQEYFSRQVTIRKPEQQPLVRPVLSSPELIFSWSADDEGDAHFLNNYFASKLVSPLEPGLLLKVESQQNLLTAGLEFEPQSRSLKRLSVADDQLEKVFQSNLRDEACLLGGGRIFLEMKIKTLMKFPELIQSLDRVVLFLHPQIESVTETYRKLKMMVRCGLNADVSVVFDADSASGLSGYVYELFSDFISRQLSLSTNYLGILHLSRGGEGLSQDLKWASWESPVGKRSMPFEKMRFLSWVQQMQETEVCR